MEVLNDKLRVLVTPLCGIQTILSLSCSCSAASRARQLKYSLEEEVTRRLKNWKDDEIRCHHKKELKKN